MGLFSWLKRKRAPKGAKDTINHSKIWYPLWRRGDYSLKNSELVFAATSRISNALSAMPISLYRNGNRVKNHPLAALIPFSPNPNMTSSLFFKTMEACRDTYGNCYALKVYNAQDEIERLDILDPARVTPFLEVDSQNLFYRISPEEGPDYFIHNYYILHIPFLSTNGYEGVNPVSVLLNTLDYNAKIHKFSVDQLVKGINAAVVIEAPTNLGPDQVNKAVAELQRVHKEAGGNILFLESGLTAKTLNLSPVDSQLFEVEKISRGTVAMVYNMPPHMMGDYSDTSFASQEQQMLEFMTLTMLPIVVAYEQELNRKLLTPAERTSGYHWKFDTNALLRADAQTRADVYQKAVRGGWKTPNEVRLEYGDKPDPNGYKLLVSKDLVTLEYLVNNPEAINGIRTQSKGDGETDENREVNDPDGGK